MEKTLKKQIDKSLAFLEKNKDHLIIDADTHITDIKNMDFEVKKKLMSTDDYYHGKPINAEDLLREMKMAEVDMSLIWQNPAATTYPGDHAGNFTSLLKANRYIFESWIKYSDKFIPAGWTDPKALGMNKALVLVDICVNNFGFPIVKMNPAQNKYPIDCEMVFEVLDHIISLGAIPAFHFGADTPFTPASGLEKVSKRLNPYPVIAVHMGGGGASYKEAEKQYLETRMMGLRNPNIKFILSAKRDTHIESDLISYQMAGEPYSRNICCASDAPYGRQTWNFGGYRWMFRGLKDGENHTDKRIRKNPGLFNDEVIQNFMGRNFAEIVINGFKSIV